MIYIKRAKTNEPVKAPLLHKAEVILNKFQDRQFDLVSKYLFPVLSNQKMNTYVKEVVKAAKVSKHITFHSARHTIATTVTLFNGVPIETVSKLLGQTKLSTTQIYARVMENKISDDMINFEKRMAKKERKERSDSSNGNNESL